MMSKCSGSALLLTWWLGAGQAGAAPFQQEYDQGVRAYKGGRFEEAILHLHAAYDQKSLPRLLINIGQAHLKLGHPKQALVFYRLFLDQTEDEDAPDPQFRAEVQGYILVAKAQIPEEAQPAPPPRELALVTPTPPPRPLVHREAATREAPPAPPRPALVLPPPVVPPPPAPRGHVVARLVARDDKTSYQVTAGGQGCTTPCTLLLRPGPLTMQVRGPSAFEAELVLPRRPVMLEIQHRTVGRLVSGLILLPIGIGASALGAAVLVSPTFTDAQRTNQLELGIPLVLLGAGTLIPAIVQLARVQSRHVQVLPLLSQGAEPDEAP